VFEDEMPNGIEKNNDDLENVINRESQLTQKTVDQ
jgi:hypothetical protein